MAGKKEVSEEQVKQAGKFLMILFFVIVVCLAGLPSTETWTDFFKIILGIVVFIDIFLLISWLGGRKN